MRAFALAFGVLLSAAAPTAEQHQPYLIQTNYEVLNQGGGREFATSRSRIVHSLPLDLNADFDRISTEEDRTGEDYYERSVQPDSAAMLLHNRKVIAITRHGETLVFDQSAEKDDGTRVVVHYYLRPYRPNPLFQAFEMKGLDHFGFYETYPQPASGRSVFYAMKFDASGSIVFALSSAIPERYRDAVRDGVWYWNRALGQPLIRVVDAPPGIRAPSADYNVIEWIPVGPGSSATHIQGDPVTGQILHAHVFVRRELTMDGHLEEQNDQLRFFVAHEVGHALGLRHNFGQSSTISTVMDYFKRPEEIAIGRNIRAGTPPLRYDRDVIRHVYLGAPLDVGSLPPFCTDEQAGCVPSAARDGRR